MSVDPGEGYRLLAQGERIAEGDQFLNGNNWFPSCMAGEVVGDLDDYRRKRTPTDDSIDRIRTAMQNHPNWAAILFGELTEPLRTDLKLVLEHYLGEKV